MSKLYVGGLPYSTTDESLLQLFAEKGYKPVSARVITERETGRSRGFGGQPHREIKNPIDKHRLTWLVWLGLVRASGGTGS